MVPDYIIATDGSSRRKPFGGSFTGYSFMILNYHTQRYITYSGPLGDKSVAFAEAWALYQAIRQLNSTISENGGKKSGVKVLAISDSKLLVDSLNIWAPYSWDKSNYYHWVKRDGSDVRNQDVFRYIFQAMEKYRIRMKLVHINSHVTDNGTRGYIKHKMEKNKVNLDKRTVNSLIHMNEICDELAQAVTADMKNDRELKQMKLTEDYKDRGWLAT